MTTYNEAVRQVVAEQSSSFSPDVNDLAVRAANLLDPTDARQALIALLEDQVKYELSNRRRNAIDALNGDTPLPAAVLSKKGERIRSYWRKLMDEKATDVNGRLVSIGAMTRADLEHNVKVREALAQKNLDRADQFRRLIALLDKYGAQTLNDIPPQDHL